MHHVTAGIVAYNTSRGTLESTLASLAQSKSSPEIALLCNSPDESYQAMVAELAARFAARLIDHRPNNGFGAAHNEIVRTVTSPWYVCCNPDVVVEPDAIATLIVFGESTPDSVMLAPQIVGSDGEVQTLARRHLTMSSWIHRQLWRLSPRLFQPFESRFDYDKAQPLEFVSGAFFAIRTSHYRYLAGFCEDYFLYCEDADLARRASKLGRNYYVPRAKVRHAWSKAWTSSFRHLKLQIRGLALYFRKFGLF